ncbi:phosphoribosyltransferase family protein [Microbacterium enclense]|uniref:Adenine phosphoribosyltransferase n=1 Tax=Microbacterium enclense TaxID=993073 RepID=A0A1G6L807_9MICO|nr:phosphoribosyltransferase family protein [Microbacterium enclense]KSU54389.1 adenine phosphoribosyltransferase [Microbacterium enclense]SDC39374.1 adenine phosphoribosyltransferase [Microbacterium enclense]
MSDLHDNLRRTFRWLGDRTDDTSAADLTGWWREPGIVAQIGPGLAALFPDDAPTVVMGPQSRGSLLGALVAHALGVGLAEVRKDPAQNVDSDAWWEVTTAPDYRDRHLRLGLRRTLLRSGDRVIFVDDWVDTGAQLEACRRLVDVSGASWIGAAVVVDALQRSDLRHNLRVRSLLHVRELL